ncbi:MAG: transglutaminase-like domain-containing protein [Pseudomonadota bacterium]|nr:transglutaminase-like domain-containing protein [Pseudomonadota bacterium]
MSARSEAEVILQNIGRCQDGEIQIFEGALALAALDFPSVDLTAYRDSVECISQEVFSARKEGVGVVDALNTVMFERNGYVGDMLTYDDLQNANLIRVIDRKKGLPVALGILYLHAARGQGCVANGLNFPGHFLLKLEVGGRQFIIDPFNAGAQLSASHLRELLKGTVGLSAELTPENYSVVGNREVLIRLQNNIKFRYQQAGRAHDVLRVLNNMILFAPNVFSLWHEVGILNARLGNMDVAISALNVIAERSNSEIEQSEAKDMIQKFKSNIN